MTQNEQILSRLQAGHTISPILALELFGSFRLAARIKDLRDDGHDIQSQIKTSLSGKRYAEYWLQT